MVDQTGVVIDQDSDVQYAELSDVQDILRSFDFTTNSNPSEDQVTSIIEKKTRYVEKNIPTAFRQLEISDLYLDAVGSEKQKRKGTHARVGAGVNYSGNINANLTQDKWVTIQLPHYFITDVSTIELVSSSGIKTLDLTEDSEAYRLRKREGVLLIDYTYFPFTGTGTAGSDRMVDTEINISYQYGRDFIEQDISEAVAKLTVYELINSDAFSEIRSEEDTFIDLEVFTQRLKDDAEEVLDEYRY